MAIKVPVIIINGFLGSGKTTLFRNILSQSKKNNISVCAIVNDMSELHVDGEIIASSSVVESDKNILESIDQGFKRAVSTIVDANLTTFIAAFALFIFGSGPIKGFSVTLMIGLITSMFTAIIITRYQIITYAKRQTRNT